MTLALIGGQRLMREATASLLNAQEGLDVLGAFESSSHFLQAASTDDPPALVLVDCDDMNRGGCLDTVEDLRAAIGSRIVLLCREISDEIIACAVVEGVGGVILKSYSKLDMRSAIVYISTGRTVMPAGWQQLVAPSANARLELSPRQREILKMIVQGRCNREIAAELQLSTNTVKFHIRVLYSRLGVRNRVEAANQHAQMASGGD